VEESIALTIGHSACQDLDSDVTPQTQIPNSIDLAHAAAADQSDHAVATGDQRARQKMAFVRR
jgi:hypothetical protein